MKQTVDMHDFIVAFQSTRLENFSREGLELLFDHLEELERDTGDEYELDVIALCCDFCEYEAENVVSEHRMDNPDELEGDELAEYVADQLREDTTVLGVTSAGTVVYQVF